MMATFDTKTAAKQWRADAMAALRAGGQPLTRTSGGKPVSEALTVLLAGMRDGTVLDRSGRRYRPSTIRGYESAVNRYLIPELGHLRVPEVRRGDVQRLVDKLGPKMTGTTIRRKLDPLRVLYRRAVEDELVTHNPTERLRYPARKATPRRIANTARVEELLDALPTSERAVWAMAFYGGLRVGELRGLKWSDVDFAAGVVRVERAWDDVEGEQETKTEAGVRVVPLEAGLRADLRAHKLATGRGGDDLVFGRTRSDALVRSTLRARARAAWKAAGLEPLTPDEGRHCCASYLAAAGVSPKDAQTILGHADVRTTMGIYTHAVPGWEQEAAAKLGAYRELSRQVSHGGA
jgi:integrase